MQKVWYIPQCQIITGISHLMGDHFHLLWAWFIVRLLIRVFKEKIAFLATGMSYFISIVCATAIWQTRNTKWKIPGHISAV